MQINSNFYNVNKLYTGNKVSSANNSFGGLFRFKKAAASAMDAKAAYGRASIAKTTTIPPKHFLYFISKENISQMVYSVPRNAKPQNKYVHMSNNLARYNKELNPSFLPKHSKRVNTISIDNFSPPHGSIAISGKLNEAFSTFGLLQCAGVSFVDKKHNLQTLMHFCPYVDDKSNSDLLKYILSYSNPEDLEITIVPGCYEQTDSTISYIVDKVNEYASGAKIKFAQFSREDENKNLVLEKGNLFAADIAKINVFASNPMDRISSASAVRKWTLFKKMRYN